MKKLIVVIVVINERHITRTQLRNYNLLRFSKCSLYQSVKAVADVYNIEPHQIAGSSSFAIKNLFWS